MKQLIIESLALAQSLEEVKDLLVVSFEKVKVDRGVSRIGYVSGIISSDGPEHIDFNVKRLVDFTDEIRNYTSFPVFCAGEVVFLSGFHQKQKDLLSLDWLGFWREVLKCGHVTDIFMTPRWKSSQGAVDEHKTAQKAGLIIHYY